MTEDTQWIYTKDCLPTKGQTVQYKTLAGDIGIGNVLRTDGSIHLPEDDENTFLVEYYWAEIPKGGLQN